MWEEANMNKKSFKVGFTFIHVITFYPADQPKIDLTSTQ